MTWSTWEPFSMPSHAAHQTHIISLIYFIIIFIIIIIMIIIIIHPWFFRYLFNFWEDRVRGTFFTFRSIETFNPIKVVHTFPMITNFFLLFLFKIELLICHEIIHVILNIDYVIYYITYSSIIAANMF